MAEDVTEMEDKEVLDHRVAPWPSLDARRLWSYARLALRMDKGQDFMELGVPLSSLGVKVCQLSPDQL